MEEYGSLALISTVSTVIIVTLSLFFRKNPILINFIILIVVTLALFAYSSVLDRTIFETISFLAEIVIGSSRIRLFVVSFWLLMVAVSVLFCIYVTSYIGSSTTIHRKFFHLTVSLIYISGLIYDAQFLWLCAWLWLSIFVLIELLRFLNVPPWAEILNENLLIFKDDQDSALLLTPIYLLVGIFSPLMITVDVFSSSFHLNLAHFAGVAAVGVGDSFAAIIGSKYGKTKWPNSRKSIEGTLAMFSSMLIFLLITNRFMLQSSSILSIVFASLLSSVIEALVQSIDNIILPLITFLIL